jgi:hypothetical protein
LLQPPSGVAPRNPATLTFLIFTRTPGYTAATILGKS